MPGQMNRYREKRLLQIVMAIACLVPILGGGAGVWKGAGMLGGSGVDLDSHFRYLSGLLLGIGLAFAAMIPRIERRTSAVRLLSFVVVIGGLARAAEFLHAVPSKTLIAALVMELVITPALCLWQGRVAGHFRAFRS